MLESTATHKCPQPSPPQPLSPQPPPRVPTPPQVPPSTPSASPSTPFSKCSSQELAGNFNGKGGFTVTDAVALAEMWSGSWQPVTACMDGDINQDGAFTLNDAVFVAEVWAGIRSFPWSTDSPGFPE